MTKTDDTVARWSADVVDFAIENKVGVCCVRVCVCALLSLCLRYFAIEEEVDAHRTQARDSLRRRLCLA